MRGATRVRVAALAAAMSMAVLLTGCTGGGEDGPDLDVEEADATVELDSYLDAIYAWEPGAVDPGVLRFEELKAECMAQAGFEYLPDEDAAVMGGRIAVGMEGPFVDAEVYGYGYSIEGPDGSPPSFWDNVPMSETYQANEEYRLSLSPEAQAEYGIAMDGDFSEYSPSWDQYWAGEIAYDPARAGCAGRASLEVWPNGSHTGPAELEEVQDAVDGIWERLQEDPRIRETLPAWSACMADAGYPGMVEIIDASNAVSTMWDEWQNAWADKTPGYMGVTDLEVVKESIPEALEELQQQEIALAVADATCRVESGYTAAYIEAEGEISQEILDTYRDDLDTWVAWAQEQQAE